jgi:excisionase family DNA binding protein
MLGRKTMQKIINKHKMPELITLKEACELLKVHSNTLRQWDKKKILPAIRIGAKRVYRYQKKDLLKLLQTK